MFVIPIGVAVEIRWDFSGIASSNVWKTKITVGPKFLFLSEEIQSAIILHETGHLKLNHAQRRLKLLLTGKWRKLGEEARYHEFEADAFAAKYGHGPAMIEFLKLWKSPGSWLYPSTQERIDRLKERDAKYGTI